MASEAYQRHIPFEACFNFRDLGGYRTQDGRSVRWRRLFRSADFIWSTEADVARARNELGLVTVIDLRGPLSIDRLGVGPMTEPPMRYHNVPVIQLDAQGSAERRRQTDGMSVGELYIWDLNQERYGKGIADIVRLLAGPDSLPAVFHCYAGKDRTGVLAAVILGLLGVSQEDIVQDYVLTNNYEDDRLTRQGADPKAVRFIEEFGGGAADRSVVHPESMQQLLAWIREQCGSMRGYVEAQGVKPSVLNRLEDVLLA